MSENACAAGFPRLFTAISALFSLNFADSWQTKAIWACKTRLNERAGGAGGPSAGAEKGA
jgi:hypothetical protein